MFEYFTNRFGLARVLFPALIIGLVLHANLSWCDTGKIISIENDSILAMLKIELAERKINAQQKIKTDEGLVLEFIV